MALGPSSSSPSFHLLPPHPHSSFPPLPLLVFPLLFSLHSLPSLVCFFFDIIHISFALLPPTYPSSFYLFPSYQSLYPSSGPFSLHYFPPTPIHVSLSSPSSPSFPTHVPLPFPQLTPHPITTSPRQAQSAETKEGVHRFWQRYRIWHET